MITLGSKVRDRVSKVEAIAIGRAEYQYRSPQIQIAIQQIDSNGKPLDEYWINEAQLEVIDLGNRTALGFCRD